MSKKESLGKLAKEAAKGVVRIPLQATKTVAEVTNHSLKGVEEASKVVESMGEVAATAGETVSIAAKIGKNAASIAKSTTGALSGALVRVSNSINAETEKRKAKLKSETEALHNKNVANSRKKSASNKLLTQYKKNQYNTQQKNYKTNKKVANLQVLKEQIASQLAIKQEEARIQQLHKQQRVQNKLNKQRRIGNKMKLNSMYKNELAIKKSINDLKKNKYNIIKNECRNTLNALYKVSGTLCNNSSFTGYHLRCKNSELLKNSRNLQSKYKIFMNERLELDINSIYNSNSNVVFRKISSIISSVRNFNTKLLNELSRLNTLISNYSENRNKNIKEQIEFMLRLINEFNYEKYLSNDTTRINTTQNLEKALGLNNVSIYNNDNTKEYTNKNNKRYTNENNKRYTNGNTNRNNNGSNY